jgi:hypothetical protein
MNDLVSTENPNNLEEGRFHSKKLALAGTKHSMAVIDKLLIVPGNTSAPTTRIHVSFIHGAVSWNPNQESEVSMG